MIAATGSARGKVILLGEHVVVYGAPAIAAGLDRGAEARVTIAKGPASTLRLGDRAVLADAGSDDDLARAFAALIAASPVAAAVDAELTTDLPPGGGLGCSAALGVAMARAVEALSEGDPEARDDRVLARAVAWEGVFHGNPSGIDTTAAARGGCFRYVRDEGVRPLVLGADLWLAIGWSGAGASTKSMVDSLARLFQRRPDLRDKTIGGVTSLVDNAALALEAGDLEAVGRLLDLNHMILAGLMLSTESIERLCSIARERGALGAKLTGAGGGGSVIALVPSARAGAEGVGDEARQAAADRILNGWSEAGFSGFLARVAAARPRFGGPRSLEVKR